MNVQAEMRLLITRHCGTLCEEAEAVRHALVDAGGGEASLAAAAAMAHKIKGSSGSIGFGAVCAVAADLEHMLCELSEAGSPPDCAALEAAARLSGELCRRVSLLKPEDSTLYDFAAIG